MNYRIVCTEQKPASALPKHAHIVAVGIGRDPRAASRRLTLQQVINMMNRGHRFFTQGNLTGRTAWVEKYWCSRCRKYHIRSRADATVDNNLDNLRTCS